MHSIVHFTLKISSLMYTALQNSRFLFFYLFIFLKFKSQLSAFHHKNVTFPLYIFKHFRNFNAVKILMKCTTICFNCTLKLKQINISVKLDPFVIFFLRTSEYEKIRSIC